MKLKLYLALFTGLLIYSCDFNVRNHETSGKFTILNTPVQLQPDTTTLFTRDFITDPLNIERVETDNLLCKATLSENKEILTILSEKGMPWLVNLNFVTKDKISSVLLKRSDKIPVTIRYNDNGKKVTSVQIKGEMNAWNPANSSSLKEGDLYTFTFILAPGNYQYLLIIDGKEIIDPSNPVTIDNNMGGRNSLLIIPEEKEKFPVLNTGIIDGDKFSIATKNDIDFIYVYWENSLLPEKNIIAKGDDLEITVPEEAAGIKRSHIRACAYNEFGISNDILIPLHYGKVLSTPEDLNRFDKRAQIIYFIMVDRFFNGEKNNDFPLNIPEVNPKADYMGGDITGVMQKINDGYFRELGVNTLWLSPLAENPSEPYGAWPDPKTAFSGYHGYWPVSFTKIDYHFGNDKEFENLVADAHKNGMNIILDYVAHHIHTNNPLYKQHPDWFTNLYLPDGTLNTEKWDEHRLTTWFDTFLPTFDFTKPEVIELTSDSALYWLKKYNLDGFRHDATKHIPEPFWRTLTYKIKTRITDSIGEPVYQIGETYGSRELISSYVNTGMLDGQFDFNVYDDAVAVFARQTVPFGQLYQSLMQSHKFYGVHNMMGYITGNQDKARFISYASSDLHFEENTKAAGWSRKIEVTDTNAYQKLFQLFCFNLTIPGVPCIYYGDEIGIPGGNDPDNRRMMVFNNLNHEQEYLLNRVKKVIHARSNHLSLVYGSFETLVLQDSLWVYSRDYFDDEVIVILCKNNIPKSITVPLPSGNALKSAKPLFFSTVEIKKNQLEVTLQKNGAEIIIVENQ